MTVLLAAVILVQTTTTSWARPPKPLSSPATIVAVDVPTQSLVVKLAKDKKPVVMDWNKLTEFTRAGKPLDPALLRPGETVVIVYRKLSFGNPELKKVSIEDGTSKDQTSR